MPLGFDVKTNTELGIIGLIVIPTNVGLAHKVVFVWDFMPPNMLPLPFNYNSVLDFYKAVTVACSLVKDNQILYEFVNSALLALRNNRIVHACRQVMMAKDRAVMDKTSEFICCVLTFVSLYGLRIVGIRSILFDDLCSVASVEWARETATAEM